MTETTHNPPAELHRVSCLRENLTSRLRVGAKMALLEGEIIDRIVALIESSQALSGVVALALASTPPGELSASEIDALVDLSYKIHLNLDQLEEIWAQVSDEQTKGRN